MTTKTNDALATQTARIAHLRIDRRHANALVSAANERLRELTDLINDMSDAGAPTKVLRKLQRDLNEASDDANAATCNLRDLNVELAQIGVRL